jgi:hypothetical protein
MKSATGASGGAEASTMARLSLPTLVPTWARMLAVPVSAPAKNWTVAAPPASGFLTS